MPIVLAYPEDWMVWDVDTDEPTMSALVEAYLARNNKREKHNVLLAAAMAIEMDARNRSGCTIAGVWSPVDHGSEPSGGLFHNTHIARRAKDASWERFLKSVQKSPPKLRGITFLDYSAAYIKYPAGPSVGQHLETYQTADDSIVVNTLRFTLFPEHPHSGAPIHILDFETPYRTLIDPFENAAIIVMQHLTRDSSTA